ncbi:methylcrotonoyl-CoA carboxylase subunit alpha, mitochondrial-like [Panonychus citri]|uniref:methylcrotonoyl-CoA carboxylase subunit alpha, mitochondrial-like n=1 Tax=Panonychus citri TaxID=50023 RepID=UPI0023071DAC|nr:methylcrotonoyl-CoA carboxylase subunit alpha, mitochondrial-like [Panonychus citri]
MPLPSFIIMNGSNFLRSTNRLNSFTRNYPTNVQRAVHQAELSKILIANRGEISCRIARTAKRMGLLTTAVYSNMDRDSMHVYLADEAINLGDSPSAGSYLNKVKLIEAAKRCGAQAIHPGYGFLSENPEFADMVNSSGLIFIGPPASAIRDMGIKSIAKHIMSHAGVPVIPGYHGEDQSDQLLLSEAEKIGFPIMIKAIKGGGGKGMRICLAKEDFITQLESARRESLKSFGDQSVLIEKYVANPRHVEVQVFADQHGDCVYLFERDCSVQRRHQKIIEEAPGPGIDDETRSELGKAAVRAAQAVNYVGAGTVEFIYDPKDGKFYFMEMNTRIQVEHPVTEMITRVDLVEWQIRVARGETLPKYQEEIKLHGHSMEARIYAEDPENNFMPGAGKLGQIKLPEHEENVRIEMGVRSGDEVSVHYDPMIAKLVVWAPDRNSALMKLRSSLSKFNLSGLKTNINFLHRLASHPEFAAGRVHTDFIKEQESTLFTKTELPSKLINITAIGVFASSAASSSISSLPTNVFSPLVTDAFRLHQTMTSQKTFTLLYNDEKYSAVVKQHGPNEYSVSLNGSPFVTLEANYDSLTNSLRVNEDGLTQNYKFLKSSSSQVALFTSDKGGYNFELETKPHYRSTGSTESSDGAAGVVAPMPGVIEKILVSKGDTVETGTPLVVMMAMKMEYIIKAKVKSKVERIMFKAGENVQKGSRLVKLVNLDDNQ